MQLDKRTKNQIRNLLTDVQWDAIERYKEEFMKENFIESSLKRENEFETIWSAAYQEGGKAFLYRFFNGLEVEGLTNEE